MAQPDHMMHRAATDAVATLTARSEQIVLVPQVLYEFYNVCTRRPGARGGLDMTPSEAAAEIARLRGLFAYLPDTPDVTERWLERVTRYGVRGKPSLDARLVAAMIVHGITHLLTFNTDDFDFYQEIAVVHPDAAIRSI
jgi:predicted nucleic acid-binding protein